MILYFWIMLVLITFLPLYQLLWAASFQGATLDFFLVTTFCTVARQFGERGKYFWISVAASILHILTIQPLFIGMALGWTALSVPTVIFLVPTFMLYIWFASSDPRAQLSLAQSKIIQSEVITHQESLAHATAAATQMVIRKMQSLSEARNRMRNDSLRDRDRDGSSSRNNNNNHDNDGNIDKTNYRGAGHGNSHAHVASDSGAVSVVVPDSVGIPMTQLTGKESASVASVASVTTSRLSGTGDGNTETMKNLANHAALEVIPMDQEHGVDYGPGDGHGDGYVDDMMGLASGLEVGRTSTGQTIRANTDTVDHIIKTGLMFSQHVSEPKTLFKWAFGIALCGSLIDEAFLISSPCWIDTSFICD